MKAVPRRLLILGGGAVGVEMAQAVRRLGGEVSLVEGRPNGARPRAGAARRGARRGAAPRRHRAGARRARDRRAARRRRTTCWPSTTAASCAATGCWSPPAAGRGWPASAWRRSASTFDRARRPGRRAAAAGRPAVGDRRRHRGPAADPRRQVPGRGRRRQHPRRVPRGQLRRRAATSSTPIRRRPRSARPRTGSARPSGSPRWPRPRPTPTPTPSRTAS